MATCATLSETSTPLKCHLSTTAAYTTHAKYRVKEVSQMGRKMQDYIMGPMLVQDFINKFLPIEDPEKYPAKHFEGGIFEKTVACENETLSYKHFMSDRTSILCSCFICHSKVDSAALLAPRLEFVNSSSHPDSSGYTNFSCNMKPDGCVYYKGATEI